MYGRDRSRAAGLPSPTPVVLHILVIDTVLWLLAATGHLTTVKLALSDTFQVWQIFSYMWVHDSFFHLFSNMLGLYFLGTEVERALGALRFLRFYVVCGVAAGAFTWLIALFMTALDTRGASGAVFGVIAAFSMLWPDRKLMLLFPPVPIKAFWLLPMLFGIQLVFGGGVDLWGQLGGVAAAFLMLSKKVAPKLSWQQLRYRWNRYRARNRLRAVYLDERGRRKTRPRDDDDPTIH